MERSPSQAPFLRLPWKSGRIGGRATKSGLLLLACLLTWILLFSEAGLFRQMKQRAARAELEREVDELRAREARLEEQAHRLATDPAYRERIAREDWGFKRPGERVYQIQRGDG